jgi:hypothetical protein
VVAFVTCRISVIGLLVVVLMGRLGILTRRLDILIAVIAVVAVVAVAVVIVVVVVVSASVVDNVLLICILTTARLPSGSAEVAELMFTATTGEC